MFRPAVSANGRFIAFDSDASNLVASDTNRHPDVFIRDRRTGTTKRVSVTSDGRQVRPRSRFPAISGDGQVVAFTSEAPGLIPGDTNQTSDVFVHDVQSGVTERISVGTGGV
jgi:Tol biopolymer transport system component